MLVQKWCILIHKWCILVHKWCILIRKWCILVQKWCIHYSKMMYSDPKMMHSDPKMMYSGPKMIHLGPKMMIWIKKWWFNNQMPPKFWHQYFVTDITMSPVLLSTSEMIFFYIFDEKKFENIVHWFDYRYILSWTHFGGSRKIVLESNRTRKFQNEHECTRIDNIW